MVSPNALPLVQYHARLLAPAWGPYADPLELEGQFLRVRHVDVREELGKPWRMTLEVMTNASQFDPSRLAGSEFSLHMLREDRANPAENDGRFFHGVVQTTEYIGAFAEAYHARRLIGPALCLLDETHRARIFQDKSVVEIAQDVAAELLAQHGSTLDVARLSRDYPLRDYCVQYGETDLAFLQRILAEEGITLAFEADEAGERTVLFDRQDRFESVLRSVEGLDSAPPPQHVPVRGDRGELGGEETIASFTWQHRVHAAHGELEQWDWKQASPTQLQARIEPEEASPRQVGAFYDHAGRRLQEDGGGDGPHLDDSAARLERRSARIALDASWFDGSSNVLSMTPGATFELDGHPDTELNGLYYCIQVTHSADNADVEMGAGGGHNYDNRFICAALDQAYTPATLGRPRIFGVQTATVVGPAGEEIHTDEYGRIKVRMHWDREQRDRDEDTSCWLRVAQTWAGAGFGSQFIPRVGMEVLVNFLGGDADRPVCTGAVYNGSHMPPYVLPDNKTQSGIKTQSSPGGDGFNELRFEDAAGREEIFMHAQRNHTEKVRNVHSQSVGATQTVSVGSNQTTSVGGKRVVNVTGDQAVTVGAPPPPEGEEGGGPANHTLTVENGDITITSKEGQTTVDAKTLITLVCGGGSRITLSPNTIELMAGDGTSIKLGAGMAVATSGPGAAGVTMQMSANGEMTVASNQGSTLALADQINLTSAAQSRFDLADTVRANSQGGAHVNLSTDADIKGANVTLKSTGADFEMNMDVTASGQNVTFETEGSKLELTHATGKLSSNLVEIAGMGMVNIGAPNVKIN